MKERPILFSAPMVRGLLNDTKTQTRRVFKAKNGDVWPNRNDLPGMRQILRNCPYGQRGDRLWVREKWQAWDCTSVMAKEWEPWDRERRGGLSINEYHAEHGNPDGIEYAATSESMGPWTPSIHMPRWASRITLEITEARVERLQDISVADAIAEGIESEPGTAHWKNYDTSPGGWRYWESPIQSYRTLWNSINGPDAWGENPWVWAVSFKRVEGIAP